MKGSIRIYVNKDTKGIYLLKEYKTKVGFWRTMGQLVSMARNSLKENILTGIKDSLDSYEKSIDKTDPFRQSPYKNWNSFFKYHDSITVEYDLQAREYRIALNIRDEKTHSYGGALPDCEFNLTDREFHEKFDEIMDFLISKVKMIK